MSSFEPPLPVAFPDLSTEALREFSDPRHARSIAQGEHLFREGEEPEGVFLVRSGKVKVYVSSGNGRTLILQIAGSGEALGLGAALSGKVHEVSAVALVPVETTFIRRDQLTRFLREHPEACMQVVSYLSTELDTAYDRVRSLRRR